MAGITERATPSVWRRVALPASIVLNLFLVALIGGHSLRGQFGGDQEATPLARALANAEATLSPKDAAAFGAVLRQDAPGYVGAAKQLQAAREALGQQITAEPFDKAAVRQALANWQGQWNHFVGGFSDTLVDALGQVSAQGRRKLIDARRQSPFISRVP